MSTPIYDLGFESNLGYSGKGRYGFDDTTLGFQGGGGPSLKNQTLAGVAAKDFYMGIFGLTPRPSGFTADNITVPSFMENLKNQSLIPSLSWAYTAGNQYRKFSSFCLTAQRSALTKVVFRIVRCFWKFDPWGIRHVKIYRQQYLIPVQCGQFTRSNCTNQRYHLWHHITSTHFNTHYNIRLSRLHNPIYLPPN